MESECWFCNETTKFRCRELEQAKTCPSFENWRAEPAPVKNEIETEWYIVGNSDGTRFVDYDYNSGYHYASASSFERGTLQKAFVMLSDARSYVGLKDPQIFRIVLKKVSTEQLEKDEKKIDDILNGLTEEQKQLLKKKL